MERWIVESKKKLNTNSVVLNALTTEDLHEVLSSCKRRIFEKNEQIVRQMDTDNNIYFIESGGLGVALFSDSGREVFYSELEAGDNFGELSAIDGGPRSASVTALCKSTLTVMPFATFQDVMHKSTSANIILLKQQAAIIRRLSERVYEFSTLNVDDRIRAELLRMAPKHIDLDGVARIPSPPTHAQLANRLSCNREAVSRELKRLENQGVMYKKGGRWIIPDCDVLRKMVDDVHRI